MDYNDDFRAVRGRKIQSDNEYYRQPPREENNVRRTRNVSRNEIRKHHQNKQKARRLFMARVRAAVILALTIIVTVSVLLLTPLCDIRYVTVEGNAYVSSDEIIQSAGELTGTNLITARKKSIAALVKTNKYINDVTITKSLIPPSISIKVSEYVPAAYIQSGEKYFVLDENLYIIEEIDSPSGLTCITGCALNGGAEGESLKTDEDDALKIFLSVLSEDDTLSKVISADFSDESDITFNYDNRITVSCGSSAELESKLRLFSASINSGELSGDANGTIDLSTVGKATYLP